MEMMPAMLYSLPLLFVVMFLVMISREDKATRTDEFPAGSSARSGRPAAREPVRRSQRRAERGSVSSLFPARRSGRQLRRQILRPGARP